MAYTSWLSGPVVHHAAGNETTCGRPLSLNMIAVPDWGRVDCKVCRRIRDRSAQAAISNSKLTRDA